MTSDTPTSLVVPTRTEILRRWRSAFWIALCVACTAVVLVPLFSVLAYIIQRGTSGLTTTLLTGLPKPVGEIGGGMGNAILGSLILIAIASAIGIPVGICAGIYLAETTHRRMASIIRFMVDLLGSIPSITVGVFVYAFVVISMKRFSAIAGGVALSIIMIPTATRTTEELLRLVPTYLREASLGLGVSEWRTTLKIVVRTALPGIGTGIVLAIARISGETAPLLFTSFNSRYWSSSLDQPIASLPVQIMAYATSPYKDWQDQAWAGALVLVALIFSLNIVARTVTSQKKHR